MRVRVLYHDHCFDGAAAAAYFTRFIEGAVHPNAEFAFTGMAHKPSQIFEDSLFDGDENAIVDFKYSSNPRLTWWFDHHQSAFLTPEDAEHWKQDRSGKKLYDPSFKSCTLYIATIARERWGYSAADMEDLVRWANIIDGAQYADARTAVELGEPAMQLTLVIESAKGSDTVQQIIRWMRERSLSEIMSQPSIQELYRPLYESHVRSIDVIAKRAISDAGVLYFDLTGLDIEGYNKFIPYYLFPESIYTVSVSNSSFRTKISVGSNPWTAQAPKHNLASICERFGGGGHPRVGAISLPPGHAEEARRIAEEISSELKT